MPISEVVTAGATVASAAFAGVLIFVTRQQAKLMRQALIASERAFVFLEDLDVDLVSHQRGATSPTIDRLIIKPRWRNNGKTPTCNMRVSVNWTHWPGQIPPGFQYKYGELARNMFLGPEATEWSNAVEVPVHVANAALDDSEQIYMWGRVDYEDIFKPTHGHFTQWCYRVYVEAFGGSVRARFVAEGDYNGSDEDSRLT